MPSDDDHPEDIRNEIRRLEVRITALRREKEDLTVVADHKPWWFRLLRMIAVVLRIALWVAAVVGVSVFVLFVVLMLAWRPR